MNSKVIENDARAIDKYTTKFGVGPKIWLIICLVLNIAAILINTYYFHAGMLNSQLGGFYIFSVAICALGTFSCVLLLKFRKLGFIMATLAQALGLIMLFCFVTSMITSGYDLTVTLSQKLADAEINALLGMGFGSWKDLSIIWEFFKYIGSNLTVLLGKFSIMIVIISLFWSVVNPIITRFIINSYWEYLD